MDLTKMSVTELKALAFDQIKLSEQTQANIRAINQEIIKKEQPEIQPEESTDG